MHQNRHLQRKARSTGMKQRRQQMQQTFLQIAWRHVRDGSMRQPRDNRVHRALTRNNCLRNVYQHSSGTGARGATIHRLPSTTRNLPSGATIRRLPSCLEGYHAKPDQVVAWVRLKAVFVS